MLAHLKRKPGQGDTFPQRLKRALARGDFKYSGPVPVLQCDHINDLTNAGLIGILDQLPMIDLLRANTVCNRWIVLRAAACEQKKSLSLYAPFPTDYEATRRSNNYRLKLDLLRFFNLDYGRFDLVTEVNCSYLGDAENWQNAVKKLPLVCAAQADWMLPKTLPNIRQLTIFDCSLSAEQITSMLAAWKNSLTSLCLVVTRPEFDWPVLLRWLKLDMLSELEHLSLYCFEGPSILCEHMPEKLIQRLKSFHFAFWDYQLTSTQTYLFRLWNRLSVEKCESFGLAVLSPHCKCSPFIRYNLKRLLEKKPALASKLTRVQVPSMSYFFLPFLCSNFPAITYLDIELNALKYDLVPLEAAKQLKHLTIRSNSRPYSVGPLKDLKGTADEMSLLPQLSSVKHLSVLDFDIRQELLHYIFPNATVKRLARGDANDVDYLQKPDEMDDAIKEEVMD